MNKSRFSRGIMVNHIKNLMFYVLDNPDEYQSYEILSKNTGIPLSSLSYIMLWERKHGKERSLFWCVADTNCLGYELPLGSTDGILIRVWKIGAEDYFKQQKEMFCEKMVAYNEDYSNYEFFDAKMNIMYENIPPNNN